MLGWAMRTSRLVPAFVILLLGVLTNAIDASPVTSALDYGPNPVGFRVVAEIDHSRSVQPRRSFDGQPATSNTAMALDIGIWYPADPGTSGTRMSAEAYKALRSPQPRDAAVADFTRTAAFAGLAISQDEAREALTTPARAVRDAKPASGK